MLSHLIKPIDRLDQQSLDCDSLNAHDGFSSDDDDDDDDGLCFDLSHGFGPDILDVSLQLTDSKCITLQSH